MVVLFGGYNRERETIDIYAWSYRQGVGVRACTDTYTHYFLMYIHTDIKDVRTYLLNLDGRMGEQGRVSQMEQDHGHEHIPNVLSLHKDLFE